MKKYLITAFCITLCLALLISCKKQSVPLTTTTTNATLEGKVLNGFAMQLVNPNYEDIQTRAGVMLNASNALIANTTDVNLLAMRTAWVNTRGAWESCEGFLFGPVEDFNYDPNMDDWPVNKVDLDSLLASSNPLTVTDITPLATTLKGFHAIEYIIFGVGSTRTAAQITPREKVYLASLVQSLYDTTTQLKNSWDPAQTNNYTLQVINAGAGSTTFTTRKAVFLALIGSMADICNEVANEKMQTPYAAQDSTLDESSFSHNSVTDFTNNITGVLHAYLSSYNGQSGYSLSDLVKANNTSLDNTLQSQIAVAIGSFKGITQTYEKAIYTQQNQIKTTQAAIRTLKATIEGDLTNYIQANVKD